MTGDFDPSKASRNEKPIFSPEVVDILADIALRTGETMTPELRERIQLEKARVDQERGENDD